MLSFTPTVIVFDVFFTDQNNYYVDVSKSFESFGSECIRLLEALAEGDDVEYGYFEYLNRILTGILLNIEEIATIIAISLRD